MKLPNNPQKAYLLGKRHGTQDNMDLVAMALIDKAGWSVKSDDPADRCNISWLYDQLLYYAEEINSGRIKRRDVKEMLQDESNLIFSD